MLRTAMFLMLILLAGAAHAQVFKCTDSRNKTVYSDKPCSSGASQTITDIVSVPDANVDIKDGLKDKSSLTRQMDDAVKLAISNDDLIRAQALASTTEQKAWVTAAKKEEAKNLASNAARQPADRSNSAACQQARRDVEREASSRSSDPSILNAKTSLMQDACGITVQAGTGYNNRVSPYLLQPNHYGQYPRHPPSFPNRPPSNPQNNPQTNPSGMIDTTPNERTPYERDIVPPFGSRFVRPQGY